MNLEPNIMQAGSISIQASTLKPVACQQLLADVNNKCVCNIIEKVVAQMWKVQTDMGLDFALFIVHRLLSCFK